MVEYVIHPVGPGEKFETLAAWARALPVDLTAVDQLWVAELRATGEDPGNATIRTVCDETRYVEIRPATGQGFAELTDPVTDPVAPGMGLGAMLHCLRGDALRTEGPGTRVHLHGLQIMAEDGAALSDDEKGGFALIDGCLIEAHTPGPAVTVRGAQAKFRASGLLQRGCGDGIRLADGASAEGVTVLKPVRPTADGIGIVATHPGKSAVSSSAVFGFRQAFGFGLSLGAGVACDQNNQLSGPENFAHPAWTSNGAGVDPLDTKPGPFAVPLRRLCNCQNGFASFEHRQMLELPPAQQMCFSVLVTAPTVRSSGLVLLSSAGNVALKVGWVDTPANTTVIGHPDGLSVVDGGLVDLGDGCFRLWLVAHNSTKATLAVRPVLQVSAGIENAGMNLGLYAGCAMAGAGYIGTGFVPSDATKNVALPGVDPEAALRSASGHMPDLRPVEGGPLDSAAPGCGRDLLGRHRLSPETVGALSLNPAPRFVTTPLRAVRPVRQTITSTEERPRS